MPEGVLAKIDARVRPGGVPGMRPEERQAFRNIKATRSVSDCLKLMVDLQRLRSAVLPGESRTSFTPFGSELVAQGLIVEKLPHAGRDGVDIESVDTESSIACDLGQRGSIGGENRAAAGHRFDERQTKAFENGGKSEKKRAFEASANLCVAELVGEQDPVTQVQIAG